MSDWNTKIIDEFRARGGKNIPNFGDRLLLLTVKGAKSGTPRTYPLAFTRDGDKIVVAASKGGSPTNPDWYRNVVANPDVEVEIGDERFVAHATPLPQGAERDRLYGQHADVMPGFHDYEQKTDRIIPVVVLERVASSVAA
ncbi:MAG TPA: nitroreductase family deazaflavin-dependent oxidoreductase [Candidatus Limnocylindrales bacterium]|jgi:deazaflavin-dependent oxidoreductase (nitroreductase family)